MLDQEGSVLIRCSLNIVLEISIKYVYHMYVYANDCCLFYLV